MAAVRTGPRSSFLVNLNMYEVAGSKPTIVHRPPKNGKRVASIVLVIPPTLLYSILVLSPKSTFMVMDVSEWSTNSGLVNGGGGGGEDSARNLRGASTWSEWPQTRPRNLPRHRAMDTS